ncbi:Outer membrane protein OprM precursor [Botrimarina colliarenosi]|uniref:Outer membrane protein OprM n=1 Tax=Botrimarina colliarenosi TaxID=2528001 RepID=A0A5C6A0Y3_9BACT|nr:TolC family protein [Botrimarina colliarenosi]TWT92858.1 Outer membrane protein OprM precursor [Botrimarina colliarenosi]
MGCDHHQRRTLPAGRWAVVSTVALAIGVLGCTSPRQWVANGFKVGPNYCQPGAQVAEDWIDSDDKRVLTEPVEHEAWWSGFNDPVLNELVAEAYRQNLTLREAGGRIFEARALRRIAVGNFFPQQQDFSASYSHNLTTGSGFDRHFSVWRGSFSLAWEVDFWGRYRRAIESSDAALDASVFDYGDVVVTLVADVAATYIDIRTTQTRLELVARNVDNQRKTYDLTQKRRQAGEASEVDVQQAKSSLAQTEAFVPQLELALRQSQNQLCVLLGIPPEDLGPRLGEGRIPNVDPEIAVGIPAATLMRRPDVRRAERQLAAQSALIGVAEADLYPQISLVGTVGRSANQFADIFRGGSGFGSVGPNLTWNLLNYGRIFGSIEVQQARFQQLLSSYRQTVLLANLEAENAIAQFLRAQERLESQLVAAEAAGKTNDLINELFEKGDENADFNRVFNVQNFKTQQEESAAIAKGAVAQGVVAIYRSVGGGWPSPFLAQPVVSPPVTAETMEAPDAEEVPADLPALNLPAP